MNRQTSCFIQGVGLLLLLNVSSCQILGPMNQVVISEDNCATPVDVSAVIRHGFTFVVGVETPYVEVNLGCSGPAKPSDRSSARFNGTDLDFRYKWAGGSYYKHLEKMPVQAIVEFSDRQGRLRKAAIDKVAPTLADDDFDIRVENGELIFNWSQKGQRTHRENTTITGTLRFVYESGKEPHSSDLSAYIGASSIHLSTDRSKTQKLPIKNLREVRLRLRLEQKGHGDGIKFLMIDEYDKVIYALNPKKYERFPHKRQPLLSAAP